VVISPTRAVSGKLLDSFLVSNKTTCCSWLVVSSVLLWG
jgi:hypothetical protein